MVAPLLERLGRRVERGTTPARGAAGTRVSVGDAARIEASDGWFDAVFDFGAIHQMPDWPAAVAEVRRVLKPGARLTIELPRGTRGQARVTATKEIREVGGIR